MQTRYGGGRAEVVVESIPTRPSAWPANENPFEAGFYVVVDLGGAYINTTSTRRACAPLPAWMSAGFCSST